MLTVKSEGAVERGLASNAGRGPLAKRLRLEWIGQTLASICWIGSVFAYGVSSTGDWLQLGAASAWLLANIASVTTTWAD